jgi:hypothetical protein
MIISDFNFREIGLQEFRILLVALLQAFPHFGVIWFFEQSNVRVSIFFEVPLLQLLAEILIDRCVGLLSVLLEIRLYHIIWNVVWCVGMIARVGRCAAFCNDTEILKYFTVNLTLTILS